MTCVCGRPILRSKKTGRPRQWCGTDACEHERKRSKYVGHPAEPGFCPRCEMPTSGESRRGDVCTTCSAAINRRIASWLEEQPERLPTGAALELAGELGISGYATTKRISRIRREARQ